jgi:hypothetical protein
MKRHRAALWGLITFIVGACGSGRRSSPDGAHPTDVANGAPDVSPGEMPAGQLDGSVVADAQAERADPDAPASVSCSLAAGYRYQFEGPELALSQDSSTLTPLRTFTRRRSYLDPKMDPVTCSTELATCGSPEIDVGELNAALERDDVASAFAAAGNQVFGMEAPLGGGWSIERLDGRRVVIRGGGRCDQRPDCQPSPAGFDMLRALLERLDEQELAKASCHDLGP